jgi:ABC-2 type transport system permease protein
MSSVEIATLHMAALPADHANSSERDATLQLSSTLWNQAAQAGPQITMIKAEGAAAAGAPLGGNPYNQSSPGMLVMFAIFSLGTSAMIFVQERTSRTLERMLTTSLKRASLIAGHLLAMAVLVFAQQAVLVLFGQLALKVNYFHDPLGVLLVMIGVALWSASMGLLIGVVARNEQRVTLYTLVTMFLFSAIGGVWFPLEGSGTAFTTIGKLTPGAWAMTGFQNILIRGLGLTSVVLPAAILLGYAVLFFSLAAWRFQKKQA